MLDRIRAWIQTRLKKPTQAPRVPGPVAPPWGPVLRRMPPSIRVEPLSVVLVYKGTPNHVVVCEAFLFGTWCGERNMTVNMTTPGDGTVRIFFESTTEELMFRVAFAETLATRSDRRGE